MASPRSFTFPLQTLADRSQAGAMENAKKDLPKVRTNLLGLAATS